MTVDVTPKRLRDVADIVSGGTPSMSRPEYWGGEIPWVSAKDMKSFRLHDAQDHITALGAANGTRVVSAGAILVLFRGMTLHNDLPICMVSREMAFNQDVKALVAKNGTNSAWLAYWLLANKPYLLSLVDSASHGTGRIHTEVFRDVAIEIPSEKDQCRIADILGTLDDKIELNRRMNETLEAMARRLFKSWFIDFDPVHAKAALRREHPKLSNADLSRRALPNMAPEIAELFPDSFEDSTLGPIPNGWRTRPLYGIARFVNGAAFKNSDFCEPSIGKPVIKIAELKSGIDSQTKFSQKDVGPDREIQRGDMLYSWSGSPDTSLATFRWTGSDGLLNQHIFKVITENRPDELFAYYQLNDLRDTLVEIARNKQTTGLGHVTVEDMKRLQVVHPAPELLKAFADTTGPIYGQSFTVSVDSLTLERTRDELLPNLLAGTLTLID